MILSIILLLALTNFHQTSPIVDGYSERLSALPGDSVLLYFNANASIPDFEARLYDLSGKIMHRQRLHVFPQTKTRVRPFENGFGYQPSGKVKVPALPSGIYLWENKIPFVIKALRAQVSVVYPANTINAYSSSGGKSLYPFNSSDQVSAQKVSFLRPMDLPRHSEAFFRWLRRQNIGEVGYLTDIDMEDYRSIQKSQLLIIPGHSEYWTSQGRRNFDRFVAQGKHAIILSGNTMWWQARYNKNRDQLICYRDASSDPVRVSRLKTINWGEPLLHYPIYSSTGTDFRNGGYGLKTDRGWNGYKILIPSPLLEGTSLAPGQIVACPSDETDGVPLSHLNGENPVIDRQIVPFHKIEIVGYDLVSRGDREGVATWIVFQATQSSGIVINTASTDWCSMRGIGSSADIRTITGNMIRKLLTGERIFSDDPTAFQ